MDKLVVAIGPSSFAKASRVPAEMLSAAGIVVKPNPFGRKLEEEEVLELLKDVDGLIAGLEPLTRRVMVANPRLRAIARVGIGMDNVDQDAASRLGIKVSNTPEGPTEAVAEMTIAALLDIGRGITSASRNLHAGFWSKEIGFGLRDLPVLLIGFGRIGRLVGEHLHHFHAHVMVYDPWVDGGALPAWAEKVALSDGLARADVISLHVSGTDQVLGAAELAQVKQGAVLLNSARGGVVNEDALADALDTGKIAAGWLDVFMEEPYHGRLLDYPQLLLTPHLCSYSRQCRLAMETQAVEHLLRDLGVS
ncbi:MAG: hydroxyacid dehydrogenase [Anaerolineae bacterium]|nr:hydroxyacid dehydrogenase [Anaerolineae bacterium]